MIELMVTLAVIAVLVALGAPSFDQTLTRNRLNSAASELLAAAQFSRTESMRLGRSVGLCPSADGATCVPNADARAGEWEQGFVAFVDLDQDGERRVAVAGFDDEPLLRVWEGAPGNLVIRNPGGVNQLRFDSQGFNVTPTDFLICRGSQQEGARAVLVGRVRSLVPAPTSDVPLQSNGTAFAAGVCG